MNHRWDPLNLDPNTSLIGQGEREFALHESDSSVSRKMQNISSNFSAFKSEMINKIKSYRLP